MLRSLSCWQCNHMGQISDLKNNRPYKCLCQLTKRKGKLDRGYYCERFEYRQWHNAIAPDGTPIKNRQPLDYRTEKQWEDCGRQVVNPTAGVEMYATKSNLKTKYKYYLIEDTISV